MIESKGSSRTLIFLLVNITLTWNHTTSVYSQLNKRSAGCLISNSRIESRINPAYSYSTTCVYLKLQSKHISQILPKAPIICHYDRIITIIIIKLLLFTSIIVLHSVVHFIISTLFSVWFCFFSLFFFFTQFA